MHYGNNPVFPVIQPGQLATYNGIHGRRLKVKVLDVWPATVPDYERRVAVRVTARRDNVYRVGETLHVPAVFLSAR